MTFDYWTYLVLPLLIFLGRIIDVSIGTVRLIFVAKGFKGLAPVLGFFEVFVWIMVIGRLMDGVTDTIVYVAYAAGFAAGNFVGMKLEEKLSIGKVMIRIVAQKDSHKLIDKLKEKYSITTIDTEGKMGPAKMIILIIDKKQIHNIVKIIKNFNPKAFYSVEDVRFAIDNNSEIKREKRFFGRLRKGK